MWWAVGLVVAIGVGLPTAAWLITRWLPAPRPVNKLGAGYDAIDRWLLKQHGLAPLDRERVRKAVFRGCQLDDSTLARAAHDLAAELASGRLGRLWLLRVVGGAHMMMRAAFIGWATAVIITSHHVGAYVILIPEGAWFLLFGAILGIWAPNRIRQRAAAWPGGPHVGPGTELKR